MSTGVGVPALVVAILALAPVAVAATDPPQVRATADEGTLVVATEENPDFLDPGLAYSPESWQILAATGDGLVTLRRAAGQAGADVIPDLAEGLPEISAGGRLLTFRVRRGVRFSPPVNREVLPSDVKASLERLFRFASPGRGLYSDIVGADDLVRRGDGGLSGVVADDGARTLEIRLTRPDPTFLHALALPFAQVLPREVPAVDQSATPPAATGPYYVRRYEPDRQIELARNPNFRSFSPDLPAGRPDRITVRIGVDADEAVDLMRRGEVDYSQSRIAGKRLAALRDDRSLALHRSVEPSTYYFYMNVTTPPFDKLAVRRAVNLATDRRRVAALFGRGAVPTAQVLPPVVPGFRRLPVTRPDLTAARRLVGEAGSVGAAVTLWGHTTAPAPALTNYMAGVLRSLGFRVTVRLLPKPLLLSTLGMRSTRAQIGYARWQQDVPDGQDWFGLLLHGQEVRARDTLNYSRLDDAGVNDLIDRAASTADPTARAAAWADVEQAVARLAPWVPVANTVRTDVTSRRVTGYVAHQTYGFLWALASVG